MNVLVKLITKVLELLTLQEFINKKRCSILELPHQW